MVKHTNKNIYWNLSASQIGIAALSKPCTPLSHDYLPTSRHLPCYFQPPSNTFKYLHIARYCSDEFLNSSATPKVQTQTGSTLDTSSHCHPVQDVPKIWGGNATVVLAHQQEVIRWPQEGQPQNLRMVRWSLEDRRYRSSSQKNL